MTSLNDFSDEDRAILALGLRTLLGIIDDDTPADTPADAPPRADVQRLLDRITTHQHQQTPPPAPSVSNFIEGSVTGPVLQLGNVQGRNPVVMEDPGGR